MTLISTASMICMAVSGLFTLLLPVALFLYLRRRYRASGVPLLVGAVSFVLFAFVLRGLVNSLVAGSPAAANLIAGRWWAGALYNSLMSGIFEETGRLCAFFFVLRAFRGPGNALAYGVGHGGIEAWLLNSQTQLNNLVVSLAVMGFGPAVRLLGSVDYGAAAGALASTPAGAFLWGGFERLVAIAAHIALSLLVWMAASGRGPWGLYFLAVFCHAVINFPAGMYGGGVIMGVWLVELVFLVLVALLCLLAKRIYDKCSRSYSPLLSYKPADFDL